MDKSNIKFIIMDVDGTLTDGKIHMGKEGELYKTFDIKDGYGIYELLPQNKIVPVIMTARYSEIVKNRCMELGIQEIHQGILEKKNKLFELLEFYSGKDGIDYSLENFAYIGDDDIDIQCMGSIKDNGGIIGCPADASTHVKNIADYVCKNNGGNGAVREFIEWIIG